jgi:hypothetical protein
MAVEEEGDYVRPIFSSLIGTLAWGMQRSTAASFKAEPTISFGNNGNKATSFHLLIEKEKFGESDHDIQIKKTN